MPPEWNTWRMVEVPWPFVCGLLHASECPTLARHRPIEPRHALEQQSIVVGREARTEDSLEWDDRGLRHRRVSRSKIASAVANQRGDWGSVSLRAATTAADHSGTAELCSVIPQRDGDFRVT